MHIEDRTYIGIVEENVDPERLGRVKVRVLDVNPDDEDIENIPWANPWKDLSGDEFKIPDIGKIVTVVFDSGDPNQPEYIYSDHYNLNLEKKIKDLDESDYTTMKSLIFDHKTQVYVNDSEGLKLDHKFNVVNVTKDSIDLAIKDNFGKVNLGTANSTQRIILGDNFLNWFDEFVRILMGDKGGPFLGNLGAPVIATPALLGSLQMYIQMKDPKFLSKNVYAVDNNDVEKLERIAEPQIGDNWRSTVKDNDITSKEEVDYEPQEGATDTTFDKPSIDGSGDIMDSIFESEELKEIIAEINPDIEVLIRVLEDKNYKLFERDYELNIIAVRSQCQRIGDRYTDMFVDKLCVFYKTGSKWNIKKYSISTVPGLEFTITEQWLKEKNLNGFKEWTDKVGKKLFMKDYAAKVGIKGDKNLSKGLPILVPAQYVDLYTVSEYRDAKSFDVVEGAEQLIWRDNDTKNIDIFNPNNYSNPELIKHSSLLMNGLSLHRGYPGGRNVGNWSEGSQVFSEQSSLNEFFNLCEKHIELYDNVFTYTLITQNDMDESSKNLAIDKSVDIFENDEIDEDDSDTNNIDSNSENDNITSNENKETGSSNNYDDYSKFTIGILNPSSSASKNIVGTIEISRRGPSRMATGIISGFPDGSVIGPINGQDSFSASNEALVEEMIIILENTIIDQFYVDIKLIVLDMK